MIEFLPQLSSQVIALSLLGLGLLVTGVAMVPVLIKGSDRGTALRRLQVSKSRVPDETKRVAAKENRQSIAGSAKNLAEHVTAQAAGFYKISDPDGLKKAQILMVRAGFFHQGAVGYFFAARLISAALFLITTYFLLPTDDQTQSALLVVCAGAAGIGYLVPGYLLKRRARAKLAEARAGFPDFMDLMVVCSNAGMSLEASINRVIEELSAAYPVLATQLSIVSLEMRAGRPLEEALAYLHQRVPLDEIRAFSNLLQQSKELGSSLTDALRVYSDDMRHQRMSKAEEKAYALPAKLSVPVSICILPVVLFIAVLPSIVRWNIGV